MKTAKRKPPKKRTIKPKEGLTSKQSAFVAEYLIDLNQTAAYLRAGYTAKRGASAENAASRLFRNVRVQAEIQKALQKRKEKVELSQQWVVESLTKEARRNKHNKSASRVKALELLGKHLGMFPTKIEGNMNLNGTIQHVQTEINNFSPELQNQIIEARRKFIETLPIELRRKMLEEMRNPPEQIEVVPTQITNEAPIISEGETISPAKELTNGELVKTEPG